MPSQKIKIYDACRPHETNVYCSSGANSFPNTQWINKFQVRSGLLRILSGSGLSYRSARVFLEYHNSHMSQVLPIPTWQWILFLTSSTCWNTPELAARQEWRGQRRTAAAANIQVCQYFVQIEVDGLLQHRKFGTWYVLLTTSFFFFFFKLCWFNAESYLLPFLERVKLLFESKIYPLLWHWIWVRGCL